MKLIGLPDSSAIAVCTDKRAAEEIASALSDRPGVGAIALQPHRDAGGVVRWVVAWVHE